MRSPVNNPTPRAGVVGADGEVWFRNHMAGHGYTLFGFDDNPTLEVDGMMTDLDGRDWFVEVKTVSKPDADRFTIAEPFVTRYDEHLGLILAIVNTEWTAPRFIPWVKARQHLTGPYKASKRRGYGRYDYVACRMAHTTRCKACQ